MSRDLLRCGFKFVGSTICYAFMQATGMVNDHLVTCPRATQSLVARIGVGEKADCDESSSAWQMSASNTILLKCYAKIRHCALGHTTFGQRAHCVRNCGWDFVQRQIAGNPA